MAMRHLPLAEQAQQSPRHSITFLPPPPPPRPRGDGQHTSSPVRPGSVVGPPTLTVNVGSTYGLVPHTPISATTLYGPYSPTYSPSPGPSPRSLLPMAARASGNYNVSYDPREWADASGQASLALESHNHGAHAEDGIANPPPPYAAPTTRNTTVGTSAGSAISPTEATFTGGISSRTPTPTSNSGIMSAFNDASTATGERSQSINSTVNGRRFRQTARINNLDSRVLRSSVTSQYMESRREHSLGVARPVSMASLSIDTVAAQHDVAPVAQTTAQDHAGPLPNPPAARRAASTGAIASNAESSQGFGTPRPVLSSRHDSWQPGMPLPGPPPGPPPSTSRSQSATGVPRSTRLHNAGSNPQQPNNYRVPLRPPVLSPLPPTPANWTDDVSARPAGKAPMPLHIETTNLDRPVSLPAGLNRSTALRVSSVKGLLERRQHRRSLYEGQEADSSALTVATNPWSDAISPSVYSTDPSPSLESAGPGLVYSESGRHGFRTSSRTTQLVQRSGGSSIYDDRGASLTTTASSGSGAPRPPSKALPTPPLSQKNPASAHSILPSTASSVLELEQGEVSSFIAEASHRHHEFLLQESQAISDSQRLQLFVDFVVEESKIRRRRYPAPFEEGSFDVDAARQLLFDEGTDDDGIERGTTALEGNQARQQGTAVNASRQPEGLWWNDYRPALSPIASMSNDELSSRGRTASRWWQSQTGSESDGGVKKMKRTKRESKYMGLSALSVQEVLSEAATPRELNELYQASDRYPEEKANPDTLGIYHDDTDVPVTDRPQSNAQVPPLLDISRFITLPPPYPRHYPAVNNGHPKLTTYRNAVRTLSDLSELQSRRSRYDLAVDALRAEHMRKVGERHQSFQAHVQAQIKGGSISYAEAAEAEQALRGEDHKAEKACLKAQFDTLQDVLINPMHDLLNDRITQLTTRINELTAELGAEMHAQNLDRPQQEGDAMPEILEYLTQLKWLFETREHMHREVFDLLTERNDKYKAIVLLPYRQANNLDKTRDTEDFFTRDGYQRRKVFFAEAVLRYGRFVQLVAENVAQEVDLQSSAFWDIAPNLHDLVQRLPDEPEQLGAIEIPEAEYAENPSYHEFPQQYLYSLLEHAEKSTYQFIESQISLYCLLHEVKGAHIGAQHRASEAARAAEVGDQKEDQSLEGQLKRWRDEQEALATAEMKQQVTMIEEQWSEALGTALQAKKTQVKTCLESVGGWDDSLQEG